MAALRTYHINKRPFRAHNANCADGFREDRKRGLIYGSFLIYDQTPEDGRVMGVEEASLACDFCAYCG